MNLLEIEVMIALAILPILAVISYCVGKFGTEDGFWADLKSIVWR